MHLLVGRGGSRGPFCVDLYSLLRLLVSRGGALHPSALLRPVLALAPPRRPWWRSPPSVRYVSSGAHSCASSSYVVVALAVRSASTGARSPCASYLVSRGGALLRPLSVDRRCSLLRLLVGLPWLSVCPSSPCLRLTLTLVPRRPSSLALAVGLPASASMAGADSLLCRVGPRRTFRTPLCPPHCSAARSPPPAYGDAPRRPASAQCSRRVNVNLLLLLAALLVVL